MHLEQLSRQKFDLTTKYIWIMKYEVRSSTTSAGENTLRWSGQIDIPRKAPDEPSDDPRATPASIIPP